MDSIGNIVISAIASVVTFFVTSTIKEALLKGVLCSSELNIGVVGTCELGTLVFVVVPTIAAFVGAIAFLYR